MRTLNQGNNEQVSCGLIKTADGFLALTFTQSRVFKTRTAAVKWLAKRGVVVAYPHLQSTPKHRTYHGHHH